MKDLMKNLIALIPGRVNNSFKKGRQKGSEVGGCYIGIDFFNWMQVDGGDPEYILTKNAIRGRVIVERNLFSVWVVEVDALKKMVSQPSSYFIGWDHFSLVERDGLAVVFPQNRPSFGKALTAAIGGEVKGCKTLC